MSQRRTAKIDGELQRLLGEIFLTEIKDPRFSKMAGVMRVTTTQDLKYAKVYISALEGVETAKQAVKGLKAAQGFIRGRLGASLHLRKTPELRFVADDSIEKGMELFDKLKGIETRNED